MGRNIWDQIIEEELLNDPNWADAEAFAIRKVQQAWAVEEIQPLHRAVKYDLMVVWSEGFKIN